MLQREYDIQHIPEGEGDIVFTIDGQPVNAMSGETVLAVLNALGKRAIARNDHQQLMGAYCGMGICHCCLVKINDRHKQRACQTQVQAGMRVETATNRFEKTHPTIKLRPVIVGGGPAGMAAAIELARHGVGSILLDEASRLGGVVFRGPARQGVNLQYLGKRYQREMQNLHQEFERIRANVEVRLNTRIMGGEENSSLYTLDAQQKIDTLSFSHLLLAAGCHERSVPFPGWTLPGVKLLGGLQLQIKNDVARPYGRTLLVGSGPLLLLTACQLHRAGAEVVGIYEASSFANMTRQARSLLNQPQLFLEGLSMMAYLKLHRIPQYYGWGVVAAMGQDALTQVVVAPYDQNWSADLNQQRKVAAETLAVGYGFLPRTQLSQQMDLSHEYHQEGFLQPYANEWQQSSQQHIHLAGDMRGVRGAEAAMIDGRIAAISILKMRGELTQKDAEQLHHQYLQQKQQISRFRAGIENYTQRGCGQLNLPTHETVICRCEKVTRSAIDEALEQQVEDMTSLKMRTRISMGDCQGKLCVGYCSDRLRAHTGRSDVGWLRPRFPIDPLPFSAFISDKEEDVDGGVSYE